MKTRLALALAALGLMFWSGMNYLEQRRLVHVHAALCLQVSDRQIFQDFGCMAAMHSAWGK